MMNCSGNKGFTLIYGKYRKAFPVGNYESERSREISMRASGLSAQFISEHRGARRETPLSFHLPSVIMYHCGISVLPSMHSSMLVRYSPKGISHFSWNYRTAGIRHWGLE